MPQESIDLVGDSNTTNIAGREHTVTSPTCLFLELAMHLDAASRLRHELDTGDPDGHYAPTQLRHPQTCVRRDPAPKGRSTSRIKR